jgi:hypothetical protein
LSAFLSTNAQIWNARFDRMSIHPVAFASAALAAIWLVLICLLGSASDSLKLAADAAWYVGMFSVIGSGLASAMARSKLFIIPLLLGCLVWASATVMREGITVW